MKSPEVILEKYWGYTSFRPLQKEIISSILEQKDTLALLPTGGGKSICYQVPALCSDGVCIVISPLISLMNDQVQHLKKIGIPSVALTSELKPKELLRVLDNIHFGKIKMVYLSPEKFQSEIIQNRISALKVNLIAIDEAHCVSEWGHDYRPSYLKLINIRSLFPKTPLLALTATATNQVVDDIKIYLGLSSDSIKFQQSYYRKNLSFNVHHTEDYLKKLLSIVDNIPTIIYVNNRKKTVQISNFLNKNKYKSTYYHAGIDIKQKEITFQEWFHEKSPIIVATSAFGMGIDKSNVRNVIHLQIPNSIENYVQETGRAGRDSKQAQIDLIIDPGSIEESKRFLEMSTPSILFITDIYIKLNTYFRISIGEKNAEAYLFSIQDFCQVYHLPVFETYSSLRILANEEIILWNENQYSKSSVQFTCSHEALMHYQDTNSFQVNLIKYLLRNHGGIADNPCNISEFRIARNIRIPIAVVHSKLKTLDQDGIISYHPSSTNNYIQFLVPREDKRTISPLSKRIQSLRKNKLRKMDAMIDYTINDTECRSSFLIHYFGEDIKADCGICDVCASRNDLIKYSISQINSSLLSFIKKNERSTIKELESLLPVKPEKIHFALRTLLDKKIISLNSQQEFEIA